MTTDDVDKTPPGEGRLERIGGLFDRVRDHIDQVDAVIERHGGSSGIRDALSRRADELVEKVANLSAIEAEVVEKDPAPGTSTPRQTSTRKPTAQTWRDWLPALPPRRPWWQRRSVHVAAAFVVLSMMRRRSRRHR